MTRLDTEAWIPTIAVAQLTPGKPARVEAFGAAVMLFRSDDRIFAVADRCTHQGAPLHRGVVRSEGSDFAVTCPAHGSVFSLADGRVRRGPASDPVRPFDARINGGMVELRPRA